jgi:hypothetical protein
MAEQPVVEARPEASFLPPVLPPGPKPSSVMGRVVKGILFGALAAGVFGALLGLGFGLLIGAHSPEQFAGWALYEGIKYGAIGALLGGVLALLFGGKLRRKPRPS